MNIKILCLLLFLLWVNAGLLTARMPNVVVILSDDQGWGDLSLHGNTNLSTPNIDSLARAGAQFERFYVSPVCSPTRAEFLTGRYHPRSGVYSTSAGGERMDLDETTLADVFQKAGYATGAFGKWHNGMQYPYHPNGRGFTEFYGFCSGHWGNYFDPPLDHNGGTNWKTLEDKVTWPVKVPHAGRYAVALHYTCAEDSIGSTVELSLGESKLTARIMEAHDPPVRGQEHDRVPRMESYVKDFKEMPLGTMDLPAMEGTLTLKATEISRDEVMDFRLLMFTQQN